jgi:aryl-alcohol dehydrogenase-like predicted oxidoreductase
MDGSKLGQDAGNWRTRGQSEEEQMGPLSRRDFLKAGVAAGALAGVGSLPLQAERATDWVTLGKSGVKVTRLAFGTGTFSGHVQQELGQEGFTRLVRYAYDCGIRFFETAEAYGASQQMLGVALKGLPRESYRLMSKVTTREGVDPMTKLDELRRNSNTEYFDILLLHYQHTATWVADTARWQDALLEAEARKVIATHGASVHGLPALRQMDGNTWLDVAMIRMNHTGAHMDAESGERGPGNVSEVVAHVKQVKKQGQGVISMKLIGEGSFNHEDRQAAMRFAFRNAGVDCVTVGYKSTAEIDEAIDNLNLALA